MIPVRRERRVNVSFGFSQFDVIKVPNTNKLLLARMRIVQVEKKLYVLKQKFSSLHTN